MNEKPLIGQNEIANFKGLQYSGPHNNFLVRSIASEQVTAENNGSIGRHRDEGFECVF